MKGMFIEAMVQDVFPISLKVFLKKHLYRFYRYLCGGCNVEMSILLVRNRVGPNCWYE